MAKSGKRTTAATDNGAQARGGRAGAWRREAWGIQAIGSFLSLRGDNPTAPFKVLLADVAKWMNENSSCPTKITAQMVDAALRRRNAIKAAFLDAKGDAVANDGRELLDSAEMEALDKAVAELSMRQATRYRQAVAKLVTQLAQFRAVCIETDRPYIERKSPNQVFEKAVAGAMRRVINKRPARAANK